MNNEDVLANYTLAEKEKVGNLFSLMPESIREKTKKDFLKLVAHWTNILGKINLLEFFYTAIANNARYAGFYSISKPVNNSMPIIIVYALQLFRYLARNDMELKDLSDYDLYLLRNSVNLTNPEETYKKFKEVTNASK